MDPITREALSNPESWKKGAVMLLFFLLLIVITPLLIIVSVVGWVFLLIQGQVPESIRSFGCSLAAWYAQTARYLTGDARRRPFPFEDLDCLTDEPLSSRSAYRASAEHPQGPDKAPSASEKAEPVAAGAGGEDLGQIPPVGEEKFASLKSTAKKAGGKKSGKKKAVKKKAVKKKAARKKAAGKKPGSRKLADQAAVDPAAPTSKQEP